VDNPAREMAWAIPAGKHYGKLFNKSTTGNWPKFPHHKTGDLKPMCLKYQIKGFCTPECPLAHIAHTTMQTAQKKEIHDRIILILNT
jgi:hypothetical protein